MTQPAIILVNPQMAENIGHAARAMLNFGLTDLRLVAPRDGWPNHDSKSTAAGADDLLKNARVFSTTKEAVADCTRVFATTVRDRDMPKPVATPHEAAGQMRDVGDKGGQAAVLFGPERSGLTNDDVVLADTVLSIPVNPDFSSLNLAQAVILVSYEWFAVSDESKPYVEYEGDVASKAELIGLMEHIEQQLEIKGYFRSSGRRETQKRMIRNLLQNSELSSQEIQTLRGVIKSLSGEAQSR